MQTRREGYLGAFISFVVFICIILIFDLPKAPTFTVLITIFVVNVVVYELFFFRRKDWTQKEYTRCEKRRDS